MRTIMAALLLGGATLATTPGNAETVAAGGIITNRNCTQPPGQSCIITPQTLTRQYSGGVGGGLTASRTNMNGTGANAAQEVTFGSDYLPILRVGTQAGATTRTGSSVVALRSFTYTGDRAINLAINGLLDFETSGDIPGGEFANDGQIFAGIRLMPLSLLAMLPPNRTGESIASDVSLTAGCGSGALAGSDFGSAGLGAGMHVAALSLSSLCGGESIVINPGQRFLISIHLQSISNRGGMLDAMNTFRAVYDEQATTFVDSGQSVGMGFLGGNVTSLVPEPATWVMMIGGFGAIGGAMRRSSGHRALAAE